MNEYNWRPNLAFEISVLTRKQELLKEIVDSIPGEKKIQDETRKSCAKRKELLTKMTRATSKGHRHQLKGIPAGHSENFSSKISNGNGTI